MDVLGNKSLTVASWITLSRLLSIPIVLGILSWGDSESARMWAALAFGVAVLTDWLDGFVARRWHQETDLGKMLDPLVDKLVVMAPLLMLLERGEVPGWGVFLWLSRELLITLWRSTASQGANWAGKAKTVAQILAILGLLLHIPYALFLFWVAVLLTIYSGILYVLPIHHP